MQKALISPRQKIQHLVKELKINLNAVERQLKLKIIGQLEAASIRRSIQQSIDDLNKIPCK